MRCARIVPVLAPVDNWTGLRRNEFRGQVRPHVDAVALVSRLCPSPSVRSGISPLASAPHEQTGGVETARGQDHRACGEHLVLDHGSRSVEARYAICCGDQPWPSFAATISRNNGSVASLLGPGAALLEHGSMTVPLSIVAAVSDVGRHVALVAPTGRAGLGVCLLAVAELGGDLSGVAVIGPVPQLRCRSCTPCSTVSTWSSPDPAGSARKTEATLLLAEEQRSKPPT